MVKQCKTWTEKRYDRTEVTHYTLTSDSESRVKKALLWGVVAGVAGAGYTMAAVTMDDPDAEAFLIPGAAGLATSAYLVGYSVSGRNKEGDASRPVGPIYTQVDEAVAPCGEVPLAGESLMIAQSDTSILVGEGGAWTLDLTQVPDSDLLLFATQGLILSYEKEGIVYRTSAPILTPIATSVQDETIRRKKILMAEQERLHQEAEQERLRTLKGLLASYRGSWKVKQEISPVDDSLSVYASRAANSTVVGWLQRTRPEIFLRCKEGTVDLYVYTGLSTQTERTVFGYDGASVRIRLDQDPAVVIPLQKSTSGDALFFSNPLDVARQMASASSMYFEFIPFNANPASTTFNLSGFGDVLKIVELACG